jgi:hypothetical protein
MSQVDRLEIIPIVKGSGLEPEEAPARRIQSVPLTVNLSNGQPNVVDRAGRPALDFPNAQPVLHANTPVTSEMTAGEVAKLLSARCAQCIHFRSDDWKRTKKIWQNAPPGSGRKLGITKMAIQLARTVLDRDPVVSDLNRALHDLDFWGVCDALSEDRSDLVVVHPEACCPEGVDYYRDRDHTAKVEASKAYDRIMRAAQGRVG